MDGTTSAATTAGTSCWESTNASSRRSGTPGSRSSLLPTRRVGGHRLGGHVAPCGGRRKTRFGGDRLVAVFVAAVPLPPRPDVVTLDHLVQRRRLDVQELRGTLLHAAGCLERRLDQPLFEVRDD